MALQKMYPPIPFSPATILTQDIGEGDTVIYVADANVFPDGPNLATIGMDEGAETIEYAQKIPGALSGCTRGVEGQARSWLTNEVIARNFTARDYEVLTENIQELENSKQPTGNYAENEVLEAHINNKENPHDVTIEQIGAATQTQVDELAKNQNGVKHYNAFTDVAPTFNAATPIVTLFQAMVPNSILDCVVNQANTVYPSAQGSLHLVKLTETTGSVQFLSSDGKLSTGAFAPVDTANIANEISGGGYLADSKENRSQTAFSGWKEWSETTQGLAIERGYLTTKEIHDFNLATENGCYYCQKGTAINTPNDEWAWFLTVLRQPGFENLVQTATAFFPNAQTITQKRLCINGDFGQWEESVDTMKEQICKNQGYYLQGEAVENFITENRNAIKFAVAPQMPEDLPANAEGWTRVITDSDGIRKIAAFLPYNGAEGLYLSRYFAEREWEKKWEKIAVTKREELTLVNGWQCHDNYRKVTAVRSGDIVTVTGMIYKEVPPTVGETVLILPHEYRPKGAVVQVPFYNGTEIFPYADITPDGAVVMYRYQAGVLFFNFSYGI